MFRYLKEESTVTSPPVSGYVSRFYVRSGNKQLGTDVVPAPSILFSQIRSPEMLCCRTYLFIYVLVQEEEEEQQQDG